MNTIALVMCVNQVCLFLSVQTDINTCPESERPVFVSFLLPSSVNELLAITCKLIRIRLYTSALSCEYIFPISFY